MRHSPANRHPKPPDDDLESLKDLAIAELRQRWAQTIGRREPPKVKSLLVRELAWRPQQRAHGGFDAETRRLLRAAMKQAEPAADDDDRPNGRRSRPRTGSRRASRPKPQLPPGAQLVRTWGGMEHVVTVMEGGKRFEYRGTQYRSLSRIAREITGARWSGPRFFGIQAPKATSP